MYAAHTSPGVWPSFSSPYCVFEKPETWEMVQVPRSLYTSSAHVSGQSSLSSYLPGQVVSAETGKQTPSRCTRRGLCTQLWENKAVSYRINTITAQQD